MRRPLCACSHGRFVIALGCLVLLADQSGSGQVCLSSSDAALIDGERQAVLSQSEALAALRHRMASRLTSPEEKPFRHTPTPKPQRNLEKTSWIPTRDTLLTSERKKWNQKTKEKTIAQKKMLRSSQSPAILHSRQFYLNSGGNLDKGQTIYLDASVKPPPVIPSCLKGMLSNVLFFPA